MDAQICQQIESQMKAKGIEIVLEDEFMFTQDEQTYEAGNIDLVVAGTTE